MTDLFSHSPAATRGLTHPLAWLVVAGWGLASAAAVTAGVFQTNGGSPPVALALAVLLPPLVYLGAYRALPGLRDWVARLDLSVIVGAQTFRVIGFVFLILWGLGQLPTVFALTAGLGDIAVGLVALGVLLSVERRSPGWEGRVRALVVMGLTDFAAALGTATLSGQGLPLQLKGEVAPLLMLQMPMAMIPTFLVPLFIILHLMAWQKVLR